MALVAADMADALKSAVAGMSDASTARQAEADALADYIMSNAEIQFAWNGINPGPPPVPDPVTAAMGAISNLMFTFTPVPSPDPEASRSAMKTQIIAGMSAALYNITDAGFSTTPLSFASAPEISTLDLSGITTSETDPVAAGDDVRTKLCQRIVSWVQSLHPPAPVLGSHGAFTAPPGTGGLVVSIL